MEFIGYSSLFQIRLTLNANTQNGLMPHSHAHRLLQALQVLAVAMNAVAQVGGGAGILRGAHSRRVSAGGERVLGVERSGAFTLVLVPLLAFALLFLPLISAGRQLCGRRARRCLDEV